MLSETIADPNWRQCLSRTLESDRIQELKRYVEEERDRGKVIFPSQHRVFEAFNRTPLTAVAVVILGQDPYHRVDQAVGLSFSVVAGMKFPPSLRNIYREVRDDTGALLHGDGDLTGWADQGVLLLNTVLTVEEGKPASHAKHGWESLTDAAIRVVSDFHEHAAFLLWGSHAQAKRDLIDTHKHLVLTAPHPSPLSAYRGFFGCKHFSRTNDYLRRHRRVVIDW